jgi:D-alanyl-D-alanine carboxypeptidase (penicillin-binding protein 5/6)
MSTSAYDMALFFRAAMRNPVFAQINLTRTFPWPGHGDLPGFLISNDNHMLASYPGTIGGKTGFTDDARHTRIAAAQRNGRRLVVVLMRGEQHPVSMDTQAARLLTWGFALPVGTPPVGQLVDGPSPSAATDAGPAATSVAPSAGPASAAPPAASRPHVAALGTIGGAAVLGALLSWLAARRRPDQRGGRHSPHHRSG